MTVPGLPDLLAPLSIATFRSRYWAREHLLQHGAPDGVARFLSWPVFNRILARHWREIYRFRLARQGHDLDPSSYADLGASPPRIRPGDLVDHLRCGATLAFHAIDEVHEPLRQLAESCESLFHASTQINVYAGWGDLPGLDLHRDEEEVFILHVDGKKRWALYPSSIGDLDRPLLDTTLVPGDVLYIPMGCYHVARPLNEPTLHVTIGLKPPPLGSIGNVRPRPSFAFPWSATRDRLPPDRFSVKRKTALHFVSIDDSQAVPFELRCGDRVYQFPRAMRWVVDELYDAPRPIDALLNALANRLDEQAVRLLLTMLAKEQLIDITGTSDASECPSQ